MEGWKKLGSCRPFSEIEWGAMTLEMQRQVTSKNSLHLIAIPGNVNRQLVAGVTTGRCAVNTVSCKGDGCHADSNDHW